MLSCYPFWACNLGFSLAFLITLIDSSWAWSKEWYIFLIWLSMFLMAILIWSLSWLMISPLFLCNPSRLVQWFFVLATFALNSENLRSKFYLGWRVIPFSLAESCCSQSSYYLSPFLASSSSNMVFNFYSLAYCFSSSFFVWINIVFIWCICWAIFLSSSFFDSLLPSELTSTFSLWIIFYVSFLFYLLSSILFSIISKYSYSFNSPSRPLSLSYSFSMTSRAVAPLLSCSSRTRTLSYALLSFYWGLSLSNIMFLLISSLS